MGSISSYGLHGQWKRQWTQIKTLDTHIIKNNFSEQEFELHVIANLPINNIKLYFTRQFSNMPKTPKVICLQKKQDKLLILVERSSRSIIQWLQEDHCQLSILWRLKEILSSAYYLGKKFGQFLITQKMIRVSQNDNILLWYNQKYQSNIIQLPLLSSNTNIYNEGIIDVQNNINQRIMIQNILSIFQKANPNHQKLMMQFFNISTFLQLKVRVLQKIQQLQGGSIIFKKLSHESYALISQILPTKYKSPQNIRSLTKRQNYQQRDNRRSVRLISPERTLSALSARDNPIRLSKVSNNNLSPIRTPVENSKQQMSIPTTPVRQLKRFKTLSELSQKPEQSGSGSGMSSGQSSNKAGRTRCDPVKQTEPIRHNFLKKDNAAIRLIENSDQLQWMKHENQRIGQMGYKNGQSFGHKDMSLKSTTGTIGTLISRRTNEFRDSDGPGRGIFPQADPIKQQSDDTPKNSSSCDGSIPSNVQSGVQISTIQQQDMHEIHASVTLSQDFNKLFSARDSLTGDAEDSIREKQFEKLLFG